MALKLFPFSLPDWACQWVRIAKLILILPLVVGMMLLAYACFLVDMVCRGVVSACVWLQNKLIGWAMDYSHLD